VSEWAPTLERLRGLLGAEGTDTGWKPPIRAHVERLIALVEAGPPWRGGPPDRVVPTPQGTIVMEWHDTRGRIAEELETSDDPSDEPDGYYWWSP